MSTIIQTARLNLRNWEEHDIDSLIAMNADKEVMQFFQTTLNEDESKIFLLRIQNHFVQHGFGLYVVEDVKTKTFLGFTGFMIATFESNFTPCIEIGWRFKKEYWGNGFATEAAKACMEFGFNHLKFDKIYSFTSVLNTKSEVVMQRIGMEKMGLFQHPKLPNGHPLQLHVNYLKLFNQ